MSAEPAESAPRPRRGRLPGWLRWSGRIAFTVGATWFIASRVGVGLEDAMALGRGVPDLSAGWMALSVLVLLAVYLLAARLWGRMVHDLGGVDPGAAASARIVLTANLGRYVPGKVWQLAGMAVLSKRHGIPATTGTLAAVLVQGFSLAATAAWGIPALARFGDPGATGLWFATGVLAAGVVLSSIPVVPRAAIRLLYRLVRRDPDDAPRTGIGFGPRWLAWHGFVWGGYGLAFHLFLVGLGFDVPFGVAAVSFAAAYLVGYLALPAPAGLGVREGVLLALLQPHVGAAAVSVAILARIWMTVVELVPTAALVAWEAFRTPEVSFAAMVGAARRSAAPEGDRGGSPGPGEEAREERPTGSRGAEGRENGR